MIISQRGTYPVKIYECSDCLDGVERTDEDDVMASAKWGLFLAEGEERPDHCPMCGSYLSLGEPTLMVLVPR